MDIMQFVDFAGSGVINDKCLLANDESEVNASYQVARQFVMMFLTRVALHPKVHIMETDGLFPVQSWYGEVPSGSAEWGMTFLIRVACQMA